MVNYDITPHRYFTLPQLINVVHEPLICINSKNVNSATSACTSYDKMTAYIIHICKSTLYILLLLHKPWPLSHISPVLGGDATFCNEVVFVYHNIVSFSCHYDAHPN